MFRLSPLTLALLAFSQSALAQEAVTLNTITVVSSREDSPLSKSANNITVQGVQKLAEQQAVSLADALRQVPGVNFEGAGRFGFQDVNIRGISGSNRVKILVDGLELGDGTMQLGPFQRAGRQYADLSNVKQVEIIKGPASSLHGSSAIGGVVSLVNKTPDDYLGEDKTTGGNVFVQFTGKNDGVTVGATVARAFSPQTKALLSYSYHQANETQNQGTVGGIGANRTQPNPLEQASHSLNAQLSHAINPAHQFSVALSHYQLNQEINDFRLVVERGASTAGTRPTTGSTAGSTTGAAGGRPTTGAAAGGRPASTSQDYSRFSDDTQKRFALSLRHDFTLNAPWADTGYWRLYTQTNQTNQITDILRDTNGTLSKFYRDNLFKTKQTGFQLQLDKRFGGAVSHDVIYGFDVQHSNYEMEQAGYNRILSTGAITGVDSPRQAPITDIAHIGAFAQDRITFGTSGFTLIPGVRYDYYKLKAKPDALFYKSNNGSTDFPFNNYHQGKASFRLGALYDVNDSNTLYANFAQGFRMPNFTETNFTFTNFARGYGMDPNPDLKPESSNGVDIGWRVDNGTFQSDLSAYYTRYTNFILSQVAHRQEGRITRFKTINLPAAEVYGVEWSAGLNLSALSPRLDGLRADVTLAYGKGKNRSNGKPINGVNPLHGKIGIRYDQDQWGAGLDWHLVAAKKASDINSPSDSKIAPSAGYGTLDVNAYYKPIKGLTVRAGVFNVFDKNYTTWSHARNASSDAERALNSEPGRWVGASFQYDF